MNRYSPYGAAGLPAAGLAAAPKRVAPNPAGTRDDLQAKLGALAGLAALTGYGAASATSTGAAEAAALLANPVLPVSGALDAATAAAAAAGGAAGAGRSGQYKGALCKFWQQSGTCSSGAACTYAHGIQELAGGYKQRLCKFHEETGQCIKGAACTYAHGATELLLAGGSLGTAATTSTAGVQQAATAAEQLASALAAPALAAPVDAGAKLLPLLGGLLSNWQSVGGSSAAVDKVSADLLGQQLLAPTSLALGSTAVVPRTTPPPAVTSLLTTPAWARVATAPAAVPALTASAAVAVPPVPGTSTPSGGQRKGALCKYFQQGVTCHAGSSCTYAHGIHELAGGFKQRICKFFDQTGSCTKGDSCTYAHGAHELLVGQALAGAMSIASEPVSPAPAARVLPPLTNVASSSSAADQVTLPLLQLGLPVDGGASLGALSSSLSGASAVPGLDLSAVSELAASLALGQLAVGAAGETKVLSQTTQAGV